MGCSGAFAHAHAHTKIDDVIKKSENRENQKKLMTSSKNREIDDVIKKSGKSGKRGKSPRGRSLVPQNRRWLGFCFINK